MNHAPIDTMLIDVEYLGQSRYAEAVAAYLARHDPDGITEAMNRVCDTVHTEPDAAFQSAARAVLEQTEW